MQIINAILKLLARLIPKATLVPGNPDEARRWTAVRGIHL